MFPPIFATCFASAAVKAVLGSAPCRIYPFGEAPQGVAMPYAVWQSIGGAPENYINQVPDVDAFDIQVDVYAATGDSARAVAKALRDAIEPVAHITRWGGDPTVSETKTKRYSFDVSWWVQR